MKIIQRIISVGPYMRFQVICQNHPDILMPYDSSLQMVIHQFLYAATLAGYTVSKAHNVPYKLWLQSHTAPRHDIALDGPLSEITRCVIQAVLAEEGMNQSKAAKRLGISRSTLWRKLKP